MTLGPRSETAGVIESIPSLPIHSSVLVVLIAGLFLAALILRARRLSERQRRSPQLTARQARIGRRRARRRQSRRRSGTVVGAGPREMSQDTLGSEVTILAREGTMSQTTQPHAASGAVGGDDQQFRIYWGRTLLAVAAAAALLGGIGTSVAAWAAALAWSVPAICGGVLVLSLAGLQVSAAARRRRKRHQRVERAMREAMNPTPQADQQVTLRQRSAAAAGAELGITEASAPFDALSSDAAGHGGPDSLVKLDEDGLPDNEQRLFGEQSTAAQQSAAQPSALFDQTSEPAAESWEPRQVPHPKYLVAEKAERPQPEPLEAPQAPAPQADTKLKQPAAPAAATHEEAEEPAAEQSIDLDAVLKRRRA